MFLKFMLASLSWTNETRLRHCLDIKQCGAVKFWFLKLRELAVWLQVLLISSMGVGYWTDVLSIRLPHGLLGLTQIELKSALYTVSDRSPFLALARGQTLFKVKKQSVMEWYSLPSLSQRNMTLLRYTCKRIQCPQLKWFAQAIQLGKDYQILENPWWQEIAPTFAKQFPPDPES